LVDISNYSSGKGIPELHVCENRAQITFEGIVVYSVLNWLWSTIALEKGEVTYGVEADTFHSTVKYSSNIYIVQSKVFTNNTAQEHL
jgi:hypothetical protein